MKVGFIRHLYKNINFRRIFQDFTVTFTFNVVHMNLINILGRFGKNTSSSFHNDVRWLDGSRERLVEIVLDDEFG